MCVGWFGLVGLGGVQLLIGLVLWAPEAPGRALVRLAAPGRSWAFQFLVLLRAPGCCWSILDAPVRSWLFLGAPERSCALLSASGAPERSSTRGAPGRSWLLLGVAGRS